MASRTNPGRSRVSIVEKVPSRACEAPVGRARVNQTEISHHKMCAVLGDLGNIHSFIHHKSMN